MAPELFDGISALLQGIVQVKTLYGTGGTGHFITLQAKNHGRFVKALHQTRCHNPNHAFVPFAATDHRGHLVLGLVHRQSLINRNPCYFGVCIPTIQVAVFDFSR